ncbi:MAG: sensor histidine kinase [Oscillatoriophycideae cyanobacterium NC_groundwater_1537_Pr4_S-0.65um_50_18]|nr:sensor histidine kinase [Oscillatoriophycideae cyanobacterium NC_groundwater_1537_Pr4_S-0.65um_50_18]
MTEAQFLPDRSTPMGLSPSPQVADLMQQIQQLQEERNDLEILLENTTEHGTLIEAELEAAKQELRLALEQERKLSLRIEELATLEERNRIARDIHDSLGHLLVGLNVQMETALALWKDDPDRAYVFLTKAKQLGSDALEATRQSVAGLRFDPLEGRSLPDAIALLAQNFHTTMGFQPTCQIHLATPLSHRTSVVLYRIVQEGLTNICKHAIATVVTIQIESTSAELRLTLKDNGKGFLVSANRSGFGLQGMQERITALGGEMNIMSSPGAGCCITASLPIAARSIA